MTKLPSPEIRRKTFPKTDIYIVKKLVGLRRKDEKKWLTDWDVSATAEANIGIESDMGNSLWYVFRSPHALQRLRDEIEAFNLPSNPDFKMVQQMTYLQAVIKESLRLNPVNGLPLWRKAPRDGSVICCQYFPAGVNVGVNIWVAERNKSVYGADIDEFRLVRWLKNVDVID